jgi:hypothetical protein
MATETELDADAVTVDPEVALPRLLEPADEGDVMREQLDYLIDHAADQVHCGCSDCERYWRVRAALLEIFGEPRTGHAQALTPALAKAA